MHGNPYHLEANDWVLHSFAKRLYGLGVTVPLTVVLGFRLEGEGRVSTPNVCHLWPLFCEVGEVLEEYDG